MITTKWDYLRGKMTDMLETDRGKVEECKKDKSIGGEAIYTGSVITLKYILEIMDELDK